VDAGEIRHALRFTVRRSRRAYVHPATHWASADRSAALPPMGARFRLKASYDISHFRADTQTILRAMKTYGLIVADNGSNWFFQGTAENGWNTTMLDQLKSVPARAFEAVDESSLMVSSNSGAIRSTTQASAPPPKPKTTPKVTSSPTPTPSKPAATPKPTPSPSKTPSAAVSPSSSPSNVVAAAPDRVTGSKTSIQLWLITLAVSASILVLLVLFLRARGRAARKTNPSK
jgi:hypothetical protein